MNRVAIAAGTVAGLGMAGLAIAHAGPGITAIGPLRRRLFPRLSGLGRPDHVALTFDDGPDPATTPGFLELLAARRLHATFFLLGSMVDRAPELAAQIAGGGHEVAVHGWDHRYTILRSARDVHSDLARATAVVAAATGQRPAFFRPPYGVLSTGALDAARGLGLTPVLWSNWGREWTAGATAGTVADTVLAGLGGGATILLHDSDCTSPPGSAAAALAALPRVLDACEVRGLSVGTLAEHWRGPGAAGSTAPAGSGAAGSSRRAG